MHHINSFSVKFCRLTLPTPFSLAYFSLLWYFLFHPSASQILLPGSGLSCQTLCRDPNSAPGLAATHPSCPALHDATTGSAAGKSFPKQALRLLGKSKDLKIKNLEEAKS